MYEQLHATCQLARAARLYNLLSEAERDPVQLPIRCLKGEFERIYELDKGASQSLVDTLVEIGALQVYADGSWRTDAAGELLLHKEVGAALDGQASVIF